MIKQIPLKYLMRQSAFWSSVRATPVLVPVAGVLMMLLSPSVMAGGFTIGAIVSTPINMLLKILFKWLHYQINGDYKGTTFLGQGPRPAGAKGSGSFLEFPLTKSKSWGMPSGHSQLAWYVAGFFIGYLFIWRPYLFTTTHKIIATVVVVLAALIVSFSRVWVDGVHTPGQVLVGGLIGFVLGLITLAITRTVATKYWNESFTDDNKIDMMANNDNAAEEIQAAAKNVEEAQAAVENAKSGNTGTENSDNETATE
jgi:membrane-associated phospholipid phosphatase